MVNRNTFPASLFGVAFMAALLLAAPQSRAAMQTFEKEYTYTASELDSKSSCRAIALEQVKRILLQELGVYVESVFNDKASTDGRTKDEVRREITTLSAGVASTEVVEEKWDGTTYWLKARIKADPDDVAKKIEALRQDKQKVAELEESRRRAAELSLELERMRKELDATKDAAAKAEQARQYNEISKQLSAEEWLRKGHIFVEAVQYEDAIDAYSKAIELEPKEIIYYHYRGEAYYLFGDNNMAIKDYDYIIAHHPSPAAFGGRGLAYTALGDHKRAIEDFTKALKMWPKDHDAYFYRGNAFSNLGVYRKAISDYTKAIKFNTGGVNLLSILPHFDLKGSSFFMRGNAFASLGENRHAIEDWKASARLGYEKAQELLKSKGIQW